MMHRTTFIFCIFAWVIFFNPVLALATNTSSTQAKKPYILPFTITVKPNTILPTQVAIGSSVHAKYLITNENPITARNAYILSLPPNTSIEKSGCGLNSTFNLPTNTSCTLTLIISPDGLPVDHVISGAKTPDVLMACWDDGVSCAGVANADSVLNVGVMPPPSLPYQSLMQDVLINADLWGGVRHKYCQQTMVSKGLKGYLDMRPG